jgi:hypothetical protein
MVISCSISSGFSYCHCAHEDRGGCGPVSEIPFFCHYYRRVRQGARALPARGTYIAAFAVWCVMADDSVGSRIDRMLERTACRMQVFDERTAETLVMNVPEVLMTKSHHGCPRAETLEIGKDTANFQVRNSCAAQGSGLIGNYSIDLNTGEVWFDSERDKKINSPRLDKLRRRFLEQQKRR